MLSLGYLHLWFFWRHQMCYRKESEEFLFFNCRILESGLQKKFLAQNQTPRKKKSYPPPKPILIELEIDEGRT